MIQLLIFLNICLGFTGTDLFLKLSIPGIPKFLRVFSTCLVFLWVLSFLYFLMLILKQDFIFLTIFLLCLNSLHLYWTVPYLRKCFSFKNHDINYNPFTFVTIAILIITVLFMFHGNKYGDFDAWALWNTHAKFLYNTITWSRIFYDKTIMAHADYPLMLPSLVAFVWKAINNTTFIVPLLLSFFIIIAITLLIYCSLVNEFQNKLYAYFAVFILLNDRGFQQLTGAQCADTLLSIYILLTFILYQYLRQTKYSNLAYLIGFVSATTSWIKNEGDLFCIVFTSVFIISNFKNIAYIKKYLLGLVIPIFLTITYKVYFAPTNDLLSADHNRILNDIKDIDRYLIIIRTFLTTLIESFLPTLILLLFLIYFNRSFFKSFAFITLMIFILGFIFIYLITPYNLQWHLFTSLSRLLYQIYPSMIYALIVAYGNIPPPS